MQTTTCLLLSKGHDSDYTPLITAYENMLSTRAYILLCFSETLGETCFCSHTYTSAQKPNRKKPGGQKRKTVTDNMAGTEEETTAIPKFLQHDSSDGDLTESLREQGMIMPSRFGAYDYTVFGLMLAVSMSVGVYSAVRSRKNFTVSEFLVGGKKMPAFPVALSLLGGVVSALSILGKLCCVMRYFVMCDALRCVVSQCVVLCHDVLRCVIR